jgi:hypothetical protein
MILLWAPKYVGQNFLTSWFRLSAAIKKKVFGDTRFSEGWAPFP